MTMVITEQVPNCDATNNEQYERIVNNIVMMNDGKDEDFIMSRFKDDLNNLVQEAFEAGFVHAQGGK